MSSLKDTCVLKPVLTPYQLGKIRRQIIFVSLWNTLSWGILFSFKQSDILINGKGYSTFTEAVFAYPYLSTLLFFPILGLFLIYQLLGVIFNQQRLSVEHDHLIFYHGPFMWRKLETHLKIQDIKNIQLQDFVTMTTHGDTLIRYRLVMEMNAHEVSFELLPVDFTQVGNLSLWLERSVPRQLLIGKSKTA
jgi:hypothetical protein